MNHEAFRTSDKPRFRHKALDLSKRQIRLLRILPRRSTSSKIRCTLTEEDFDVGSIRDYKSGTSYASQPLRYKALSYTWGSRFEYPANEILINGCCATVGGNLWLFLNNVASGELPYQLDQLWIDQLCINQEDNGEKPHQVKQMGDIFANAEAVIIWLGRPMGFSFEAQVALRAVARYSRQPEVNWAPNTEEINGFQALLKNAYWGRLWVVQEILLAKSRIIACGDQQVDWDSFKRAYHAEISSKTQEWWIVVGEPRRIQLGELFLEQSRPWQMLELLDRFGHCNSKDSRDKVYGLLGLSSSDSIEVDYQKSPASVYWSAWAACYSTIGLKLDLERMVRVGHAMWVTGREPECNGIAGQRFQEVFNVRPSEAFAPCDHAVTKADEISRCRCGFMAWVPNKSWEYPEEPCRAEQRSP